MFARGGVERTMGLGGTQGVSLALARELAAEAREKLARGEDPIEARRLAFGVQKAERIRRTKTFELCAKEFHSTNAARWRNEKHKREWLSAVTRFAFPTLGRLAVSEITSEHIVQTLTPLLYEKPITAYRLRGRIEVVLKYARAMNWREGENPASKDVIRHLLPLRSEKANVKHQPALPFDKVPALMQRLRTREGTDARLLEMIILSAMRMEAVREARFTEFDLAGRVWTIPADRMKTLGRAHRVPLTDRMVDIVKELRKAHSGPFVFGGEHRTEASDARELLVELLEEIGHTEHAVPHGFRSSFTDWAHEAAPVNIPDAVIEMALGHRIKSSVTRAYRRGELFERREVLMGVWESFCLGHSGDTKVVKLRS